MKEIEKYIIDMVRELAPVFSKLEFKASIGDTSRIVEFFVWKGDSKRKQCYDLADHGEIDERKMESSFDNFANFIRGSDGYKAGEVNKIHYVFENDKAEQ